MKENGRSMVEMLGVLAIVGILSAGALKGYSNAMFKHKMNKTIDETTKIFQRFEELNEKDWGATKEEDVVISIDNAVAFGLLEKCELDGEGYCQLPLGKVQFDIVEQKGDDADLLGHWGLFGFRFTDSKTCIAFLSAHWEQSLPRDWWNPSGSIMGCYVLYDPNGKNGDNIPITEVGMSDIIRECSCCNEGGVCDVTFIYRGYF